jgi:hypothetical protein
MLRVVTDDSGRAEMRSALDDIVLAGAQRMLAVALEAEVDAYIAGLTGQRVERGRRLVVRNGHAEVRTITTAAGRIEVETPRVNDRRNLLEELWDDLLLPPHVRAAWERTAGSLRPVAPGVEPGLGL